MADLIQPMHKSYHSEWMLLHTYTHAYNAECHAVLTFCWPVCIVFSFSPTGGTFIILRLHLFLYS